MTPTSPFFPFHPRQLRGWLLLATAASVGVAIAAALHWRSTHEVLAAARLGIGVGLMSAFAWLWFRLRPRAGWGVKLGDSVFSVSRPLSMDTLVPWSELRGVSRVGDRRQTLRLELATGVHLFLPRALFASASDFEACARAIEERAPARYDA